MEVLRLIHLDYSLHVFLLDKIDDLTTIGYDFERLARHDNLFVFENLPVLKPTHDS